MVDLSVPRSSAGSRSDASLTGCAVCPSRCTSPAGVEAVSRWLGSGITPSDEEVGLGAIFDGISGPRQEFERVQGIKELDRDLACDGSTARSCAECVASMKEFVRVDRTRLTGCTPLRFDAGKSSHACRQWLLWCHLGSEVSWTV